MEWINGSAGSLILIKHVSIASLELAHIILEYSNAMFTMGPGGWWLDLDTSSKSRFRPVQEDQWSVFRSLLWACQSTFCYSTTICELLIQILLTLCPWTDLHMCFCLPQRTRRRRVRDPWGNWCDAKDLEGQTFEVTSLLNFSDIFQLLAKVNLFL